MRIVESIEDFNVSTKILFKKIIFITNDRSTETNKTLAKLTEALEGTDVELIIFVAEEMHMEHVSDGSIKLLDSESNLTIKDESVEDILVIVRLGAQNIDECEQAVELLQDKGFLVLNPIKQAHIASDKYATALLLAEHDLPQPNFALITKTILDNSEKFTETCTKIYPEWGKDLDEDKKKEFVIKTLGGHGGTGVFLLSGDSLLSVLQAIFSISPEISLLIQKKEQADGGDIRVHVITMRGSQKILGAMKRKKIDGDFRSNISLGASAEPVELTPEQEQIALKAARISGLPWCAVDIMPLVKDSNPEIGDNVILEFNASPGTEGISEILEENFMRILLSELNDPSKFILQDKIAGFRERITIKVDKDNEFELLAKLDTGNGAKASCIAVDSMELSDDESLVTFTLQGKEFTLPVKGESNAKIGNSVRRRHIVEFKNISIGGRSVKNASFAVDDERDKTTDVLINRNLLKKLGFIISPARTHLLSSKMPIKEKK